MSVTRRWFGSLAAMLRGKDEELVEEEYSYFTLSRRPLPAGFSHADLGCGSRKAKATLLGYPDRQADIGIYITMADT